MCVNLLAPECAVFLCLCVWYQIRVPVKNHIICQTSVNLMPCCIQHTSTQIPPLPLFLLQISPPPPHPTPIQGFIQALLLTSVCHEGLSFYEGCVSGCWLFIWCAVNPLLVQGQYPWKIWLFHQSQVFK